ncbi:MAG: hypothetical protein MUF62_04540 [Chitinophagaceae bacterium]|jgi:YD repeat-containing protein|nr:hypothetical protein [Chitinophagaceae bacterium]
MISQCQRKLAALFVLMAGTLCTQAQYFYQDLLFAQKTEQQFRQLKAAGVKTITANARNADGSIPDNFSIEQRADFAANTLSTQTLSDFTGRSELVSRFDANGKLQETIDQSGSFSSTTRYSYNASGWLQSIAVEGSDTLQQFSMKEQRIYTYNSSGQPTSMLRIKNNTDTTRIVFVAAENGRPGEEQWWKGARLLETYYYYYDDQLRLTDVARYNQRAQRILPDLVFEYTAEGLVARQLSVPANSKQYRTYRYSYDSRGLKIKEEILNKQNTLEAIITYSYL